MVALGLANDTTDHLALEALRRLFDNAMLAKKPKEGGCNALAAQPKHREDRGSANGAQGETQWIWFVASQAKRYRNDGRKRPRQGDPMKQMHPLERAILRRLRWLGVEARVVQRSRLDGLFCEPPQEESLRAPKRPLKG